MVPVVSTAHSIVSILLQEACSIGDMSCKEYGWSGNFACHYSSPTDFPRNRSPCYRFPCKGPSASALIEIGGHLSVNPV